MSRLKNIITDFVYKANETWNLWNSSEPLLIGVSGGKDSLALLSVLSEIKSNLHTVHVRLSNSEKTPFIEYCLAKSTYHQINTNIREKSFSHHNPKNPCYTCSRLRRKAIVEHAHANNIKKIVLGHHRNDVAETLLLNIFFSREISTMMPGQEIFDGAFQIVRPFYLVPENLILKLCQEENLPVAKSTCPQNNISKRYYIKKIIQETNYSVNNVDIYDNIFNSMFNYNSDFMPGSSNR